MSKKIKGRLLTPVNSDGDRVDIHLITTSDEIIVPKDGNEEILTNVLNDIHTNIEIGTVKPSYPSIWFRTNEN